MCSKCHSLFYCSSKGKKWKLFAIVEVEDEKEIVWRDVNEDISEEI